MDFLVDGAVENQQKGTFSSACIDVLQNLRENMKHINIMARSWIAFSKPVCSVFCFGCFACFVFV